MSTTETLRIQIKGSVGIYNVTPRETEPESILRFHRGPAWTSADREVQVYNGLTDAPRYAKANGCWFDLKCIDVEFLV